jgi:hypothetical protein
MISAHDILLELYDQRKQNHVFGNHKAVNTSIKYLKKFNTWIKFDLTYTCAAQTNRILSLKYKNIYSLTSTAATSPFTLPQ